MPAACLKTGMSDLFPPEHDDVQVRVRKGTGLNVYGLRGENKF